MNKEVEERAIEGLLLTIFGILCIFLLIGGIVFLVVFLVDIYRIVHILPELLRALLEIMK